MVSLEFGQLFFDALNYAYSKITAKASGPRRK